MAKRRTLDSDGIWRPKKLKIVFTDEKMTASSGLGPLVDAFADSKGYERLRSCVPSRNSNASYDPMQFVLALIGGCWHGYDCLDDVENLEGKPDMSHRMEGIPSARAIGDFLRAFDTSHFTALNEYLTKGALAARKVIAPEAPVVLDMDGTSHVQSGKLIEGLRPELEFYVFVVYTDKDGVVHELETALRRRVPAFGVEIVTVGIRDVILPGDMKDLMNKVTEAKKAAEANLIVRREETAAMRSQANTAKLLEGNPTLMRLRELEVLEKVAAGGKLNVVLGEKGLAERVVNLL